MHGALLWTGGGGEDPTLGLEGYEYKGRVKFVHRAASRGRLAIADVVEHASKSSSQLGAPSPDGGPVHGTLLVTREGHLYHKK
jgi:hypothetical protein